MINFSVKTKINELSSSENIKIIKDSRGLISKISVMNCARASNIPSALKTINAKNKNIKIKIRENNEEISLNLEDLAEARLDLSHSIDSLNKEPHEKLANPIYQKRSPNPNVSIVLENNGYLENIFMFGCVKKRSTNIITAKISPNKLPLMNQNKFDRLIRSTHSINRIEFSMV
jgi:hypothetical protein